MPVWGETNNEHKAPEETPDKNSVLTGFSGGMFLHAGYAFAESPDALFRNGSLSSVKNVMNLPSDGITLGLGGALRTHLIDHIHLGLEGGVSQMPLMKSGSNIRTAFGGVICDWYFTIGKVRPFVGGLVGGGANKRLFVPDAQNVVESDSLSYNASYTKTPFFLLDPYIGIEIKLGGHANLVFKLDYMLPFGDSTKGISSHLVTWSNFISPSGPRLYVGIMFGKYKK